MELKDFIGKAVISRKTRERYYITEITSAYLRAVAAEPGASGYPSHYIWSTINGDSIKNGELVFEDIGLTEPFVSAYDAHCSSKAGYWEDYGYWMRKD